MEYTKIGNTDIEVSKLCIGCMSFGQPSEDFHKWTLNQNSTTDMVRLALDKGINFFDTANVYSHGTSEEYLGKAIKNTIARDKVVIATKVYFNEGNLTRKAIYREIDGSLKRLGTDYVDLYIIHRFDYNTPIEETMDALNDLIKSGKVRAIGASAMYGYQFQNMQHVAEKNGWAKFSAMENHYNLLYREDERELIPICKEQNVMLMPYSPLAGGHLGRESWNSDSLRGQTDAMVREKYDATAEQDMKIVENVRTIANKYGVKMSQIALAWLYAKGIASPIIGATKEKYIEDALGAFDIELTVADMEFLEENYLPHRVVGAL